MTSHDHNQGALGSTHRGTDTEIRGGFTSLRAGEGGRKVQNYHLVHGRSVESDLENVQSSATETVTNIGHVKVFANQHLSSGFNYPFKKSVR